jgi:GH15 family glucan-1,4-alpha-glucosidase
MDSLYHKSIHIIKNGQSESGAYIACPNFPTYHYCWLRDGSFIAHAMDTSGEYSSAEAYFRWVGRTVLKYGSKVEEIRVQLKAGKPIGKDDVLHTRFTLDGNEVTEDSAWGNFQIDGYGTWLWALAEHVQLSGNFSLLKELSNSIQITIQYLELVWKLPNYDCWEEHQEYLHPYSLSTVFAGLNAIAPFISTGLLDLQSIQVKDFSNQVKEFILRNAVNNGHFVKHVFPEISGDTHKPVFDSGVDSSLIGISVPFNLFPVEHPLVKNTIHLIEHDLHRSEGGVYRYKSDVYYGGGEWVLLTAWLGWFYAKSGEINKATSLKTWIESQADTDGCLAEQVSKNLLFPEHFEPWQKKWGHVANPLLWSHAMYIILVNAINESKS